MIKLVYVCSPYRDNPVKNTNLAMEYCKVIFNRNNIPIAPHLYFPLFMNDNNKEVRELALELNKRLIDMCDYVVVFGYVISEGMKIEIEYAHSIGKEVMQFGGI